MATIKNEVKVDYIIANKFGKYMAIDEASGGYPYLNDERWIGSAKSFKTPEKAKEFLLSDYVTKIFKDFFDGCYIVKRTTANKVEVERF